nr:CDP-alcohol phosphatidyltransferase family protein [Candidatus Freyrarchaeum guaymaensis]
MPQSWDGIVSRSLNRRISRPIARFLSKHRVVTPNQVTVLSFLVSLLSPIAFYFGIQLLGGILAQLSSILDGVDGDLAKMTGKTTPFGGFLDSVLDRYADVAILAGMGLYGFFFEGLKYSPAFCLLAILGALMVSYSRAASERIPGFSFQSPISNYLANRDVRLFIIFIASILSFVSVAFSIMIPVISYSLIVIAAITNLTVARRLLEVRTWQSSNARSQLQGMVSLSSRFNHPT